MTETKPKRRWFRFSLRTLFVLVTIIGVAAGWVEQQLNWIRQRHTFLQAHDRSLLCSDTRPAPWQLRVFGEPGYEHQMLMIEQKYLQQAKELFPEVDSFQVVQPGNIF